MRGFLTNGSFSVLSETSVRFLAFGFGLGMLGTVLFEGERGERKDVPESRTSGSAMQAELESGALALLDFVDILTFLTASSSARNRVNSSGEGLSRPFLRSNEFQP